MKEEPSSSAKQKNSIVSNIFTSNADLAAVLFSTFVIIALMFLPYLDVSIFREVLGVVIVVFNPGYALTAALFPRRHDLSNIERITLAFGLSIAIVPLLVFVLAYYSPLALGPAAGVLTLIIISGSVIGLERRRNLALDDRFTVEWRGLRFAIQLFLKKQNARDRTLNILLIVSLVSSTSVVAYAITTPNQSDAYTEFYVLNSKGEAKDYPTQMSLRGNTSIELGIANHEGQDATYNLVIQQNESPQPKTLYSEQLTINANGQWEKTITFRPVTESNNAEFKFLLYKNGNSAVPYRETHLFANVTA